MASTLSEVSQTITRSRRNRTNLLKFIRDNSFCTLITCDKNELFVSHVNLMQHRENSFFGHLAVVNPQAKQLKNGSLALAIFKNPSVQRDEISTVHLHGTIEIIHEDDEMARMLGKLTLQYESGRNPEWSINWDEERFRSQIKGVVGFNITPTLIEEALFYKTTDDTAPLNIAISVDINNRPISTAVPIYAPLCFSEHSPEVLTEFMMTNPSCTLIIYSETGLLHAYHLNQTNLDKCENMLHIFAKLALPDPLLFFKKDSRLNALLIFNGPHTYISPTWYKAAYSVPTWNYTVVHAHGVIHVLNQQHMNSGLLELDLKFEVIKIGGKFKLNQNRTLKDRRSVVDGLRGSSTTADLEIAQLMNKSFLE